MRSRRNQDQLILQKRLALDFAASRRTFDKAQLDLLLFHGIDDLLCVAADQCRMNAGMLFAVLAQKTRQHILSDGCGSSKGKLPGMIPAQRGNLMFRLDKESIRLLRVTQQNLAGLGLCDLLSSAIKELDANILLERLDLEADCGLRQIQLFSCLAEAALLGNGSENNQAKIIETRHRMIRTPLASGKGESNKDSAPCAPFQTRLHPEVVALSPVASRNRRENIWFTSRIQASAKTAKYRQAFLDSFVKCYQTGCQ